MEPALQAYFCERAPSWIQTRKRLGEGQKLETFQEVELGHFWDHLLTPRKKKKK